MSYAKVTAMVFPMVVNPKSAPKDNNRYQRVKMSGDSSRDSDVDSTDSSNRESSAIYEIEPGLGGKLNKGSQTDIMLTPPMYPPPPPPNQLPKAVANDKRKVRTQDFQGDSKNENALAEKDHFNVKVDVINQTEQMDDIVERRLSRCEHCSQITCSTSKLDTPIDNEPVAGAVSETEGTSVANSERQRTQQQSEDSCAMECLYYAVQCSDCTLL